MEWYKFDKSNISQIQKMLDQLSELAINANFDKDNPDELTTIIISTMKDINLLLFGEEVVAEYGFGVWRDSIARMIGSVSVAKNQLDVSFALFMGYISLYDEDALFERMKSNLMSIKTTNPNAYEVYITTYSIFENLWGALNPDEGVFDVVKDRAKAFVDHFEDFIWLYIELSDYRSKHVLYGILRSWYTFEPRYLVEIREKNYDDYFDFDLIPQISDNEVFVDMGAFTGDTLKSFIENYGTGFGKYICYEAIPEHCRQIQQENAGLENLIIRNKAVGDKAGVLHFDLIGGMVYEDKAGEIGLEMVSLDDDIDYPVTWLKMDIEGSEQLAIRGSKRHICEEKPKLSICTYHNNEDIWKVARMVKEMRPDYKLYMRYNADTYHPSEYVLFAL